MIKRSIDNVLKLSDKLKLKMTTSLLDSGNPYMSRAKDSINYPRLIRWEIKLEYSTKFVNTIAVGLTGGDLMMLENFIESVIMNTWFVSYSYNGNSIVLPERLGSKQFITDRMICLKFTPTVYENTRAVELELAQNCASVIEEYKIRELLYFLKKFDPYAYSNISASMLQFMPDEHLSNIRKNFFDNNPNNQSNINNSIPETPKLKGKQIGDRNTII